MVNFRFKSFDSLWIMAVWLFFALILSSTDGKLTPSSPQKAALRATNKVNELRAIPWWVELLSASFIFRGVINIINEIFMRLWMSWHLIRIFDSKIVNVWLLLASHSNYVFKLRWQKMAHFLLLHDIIWEFKQGNLLDWWKARKTIPLSFWWIISGKKLIVVFEDICLRILIIISWIETKLCQFFEELNFTRPCSFLKNNVDAYFCKNVSSLDILKMSKNVQNQLLTLKRISREEGSHDVIWSPVMISRQIRIRIRITSLLMTWYLCIVSLILHALAVQFSMDFSSTLLKVGLEN